MTASHFNTIKNAKNWIIPGFILLIPFSTFITTVASLIIAILYLALQKYKLIKVTIKNSPPALWAILLFGTLFVSVFYSTATHANALSTLSKYRELLLLIILPPFLAAEQENNRCQSFITLSLFISLIFSYLNYFHILPSNLTIFKGRITYSIFISFLGFYCLHQLAQNDKPRKIWAIATALVLFNLFVVCDGRTGQVIFLALCGLFFFQVSSFKTAVISASLAIGLLIAFVFYAPSSARYIEGINESINFYQNYSDTDNTSMGLRLRFWSNTFDIIKQSIWIGHGVGGLPVAFKNTFPNLPILFNPHNEFLLITAQIGVVGLAIFIAFLTSLFKASERLPLQQRHLLQGVTCSLIICCLFNSPILDHTEGHWFMSLIALYSSRLIKIQNA